MIKIENKIIFCKVDWYKYYDGTEPKNEFDERLEKTKGQQHERFNFKKYGDSFLGFVNINGAGINLNELNNNSEKAFVIFFSDKREANEFVIVGFYKDATCYNPYKDRENNDGLYCLKSKIKNSFIIKHNERNIKMIKKERGTWGQSMIWYAKEKDINKETSNWIKKTVEQLLLLKDKNNKFDSKEFDSTESINDEDKNSQKNDLILIKNKIIEVISIIKDPYIKLYLETVSSKLSKILRDNYRNELFERNKRYNDVDSKNFDLLANRNNKFFEAAHIVDVKYIKQFIFEKLEILEQENALESKIDIENIKSKLNLMLSKWNGIFIPFKYHYYFDKNIIYLNSNLEFKVNEKYKEVINLFNEEFINLKKDLSKRKEVVELVKLRNEYRNIK